MADQIQIDELLVRTIVGINPDEREKPQDVLINLTFKADLRPAGESDDISDAVNYRTIAKEVIALIENSRFFLIERMAEEIARMCLSHGGVQGVVVNVQKPGALRFARNVGVTIERSRSEVGGRSWEDASRLEHEPMSVG